MARRKYKRAKLEYAPFWVSPEIHKLAFKQAQAKSQTLKGYIEKLVLKDNI